VAWPLPHPASLATIDLPFSGFTRPASGPLKSRSTNFSGTTRIGVYRLLRQFVETTDMLRSGLGRGVGG